MATSKSKSKSKPTVSAPVEAATAPQNPTAEEASAIADNPTEQSSVEEQASSESPEAVPAKPATKAKAKGNDIPKTSATSAVTTDLPQQAEPGPQAEQEVADTQSPAVKNGIGLVRVDGIDLRYVGIAPARDKGAKTPGGLAITPENSTFTTLDNVAFHPSIRIKDPKSGEFYYPADGVASWEACELNGSKLLG